MFFYSSTFFFPLYFILFCLFRLSFHFLTLLFSTSFSFFFFLMIRRPPRSTLSSSSAASDVYKRQDEYKANLVSSFVEHALPQFTAKDKALVPVISKVLPLEEVREAHRMVGANETIGKVVLTF
eukprot:TRINITY_DN16923_c0_g1_i4.p1 TRINITY_DN16923_c0_g1~~TRINITY_DN16923_c0_g1_i4.p1  ORF type:complete len:124 (+),score=44.53 TRINITY_DN16923_c0_g1_i4:1-372(+)